MNIKFSIVIPLYNKERNIRETLNSILKQDFNDYEIVVIDDGSTDNSLDIVSSLARTSERIKLYRYDNAGVSIARNRGIEKSRGAFIIFLDADDVLFDGYLLDANETVDKINGDFALLGYNYQINNKPNVPLDYPEGYVNYFELYLKFGPPFCSSSVIMNKICINDSSETFPPGEWLGEDIYAWSKIILRGGRVYFRNKVASKYVIEASGAMKKKKTLIKLLRDDSELISNEQCFLDFLLLHKKDYLRSCLVNGDYNEVRSFLANNKDKGLRLYKMIGYIPYIIIKIILILKRKFK
ncbi:MULTISPECIES: glycosyltransferase family 2 protein [Enterobacter]|uniref:glycosyltransferase family 2 protein n=1 Tax=Enterobacter TaxID=547 RepID=UPI00254CEE50|nr:glycosyltransferase family 2 protein [Enterobacter sp. MEB024]